jgi:hypothetical protein
VRTKWSHVQITFTEADIKLASFPHIDVMVITAHIDKWNVTRVLVDNRSQEEILFLSTFEQMGLNKKQVKEVSKPLYSFGGRKIEPIGSISLPVSFGSLANVRTECITFDVVDMSYPYNASFGRGLLNTFEASLHSLYLCLKVPAALGVISIHGNKKEARSIEQCFTPGHRNVNCLQDQKAKNNSNIARNENEGSSTSRPIEPECETKGVPLDPRVLDKVVMISQDLTADKETELLSSLDKNNDVFMWRTSDLIGVSRDIIEHKLQVNPSAKPKKQRLHKMSDEKVAVAKAEVQRLLNARFIREIHYPSWLVNVVMVEKKNDKWKMCTNFTNLNKCCPKDAFLLSRIDKVVDSVAGSKIMALLDCFLGYHQIWLCMEDEEKTSFITPFGTYCYLRMPECLKNAAPTFCRMTKAILKEQMERNVFAYVDDIVVASRKKETLIQDLAETFTNMRKAQLKLNPEKCVFGVQRGRVLDCLVSVKGIEAYPDKINVMVHIKPLGSRKEV